MFLPSGLIDQKQNRLHLYHSGQVFYYCLATDAMFCLVVVVVVFNKIAHIKNNNNKKTNNSNLDQRCCV